MTDTERLLAAHKRLLAIVANQSYTSVADGGLNIHLFADEPIRITATHHHKLEADFDGATLSECLDRFEAWLTRIETAGFR
jgi:hypothetical protein